MSGEVTPDEIEIVDSLAGHNIRPDEPATATVETTVKVTPRRSIGKVEIKFTNPDFIAYLTPRSATQIAALCHKYAAQVRAFDKRNKR